MKKISIILGIFFLLLDCKAQKEADNWYFGDYAAISFASGAPITLSGGKTKTDEGCSTISDSLGNLLFYTDGSTVWNKNHQIMTNGSGLKGNFSSTQSGVIAKVPNSKNLYFLFTLDSYVGTNGFQYNIIDISKQSGLGEVVSKNNFVKNGLSEKLSISRSCDGNYYWVLVHEYNSNKFFSYKFDNNGINGSPVISSVGNTHNHGHSQKADCVGYMKFSPNNKKLALAIGYTNKVELFDFDNTSGKVSNAMTFTNYDNAYGIEFSQDSKILYVSEQVLLSIIQYDITSNNFTQIKNSAYTVGYMIGTYAGSLQMANNGKIYCANRVSKTISCINNPNKLGSACNYVKNAFTLSTGDCRAGFPNFLPNFFALKPSINKIISTNLNPCSFQNVRFSLLDSLSIQSVKWYFGDTKNSTSILLSPSFTYIDSGTYNVKAVYFFSNCLKDSVSQIIKVNIGKKPNIGKDTTVCSLNGIVLSSNIISAKYKWNNSSTDTFKTYLPKKFGNQILEIITACGILKDTMRIDSIALNSKFSLGNDTNFCQNFSYTLKAKSGYNQYEWNTGEITNAITINAAGSYWVKATGNCGNYADTIKVSKILPIPFTLGNDTNICNQTIINLIGPLKRLKYNWSSGEISTNIIVNSSGIYKLTVTDSNNCIISDSINIAKKELFNSFNLGNDTNFCTNFTVQIGVNTIGKKYVWNTGDTIPKININQAGQYILKIFNLCQWIEDTINITQEGITPLNLGLDTALCFARPFQLFANTNYTTYQWQNGETTPSINIHKSGKYWLKVTDFNGCESIDTINFTSTIGEVNYFIPNAFSPNDDDVNEYFPFSKQEPNVQIEIYNRWGELIYENNDGIPWNGKVKNEFASQDVYMYIITYKNCNKTKLSKRGTFTLLK